MKKETATVVVQTLESCLEQLFKLIPELKEGCESNGENEYYQREIARLANLADLNILDHIAKQYPELSLENKNRNGF
jgi:hypothetical protein